MSGKYREPDTSPLESSDAELRETLRGAFLPDALDPEHNALLIEHALALPAGTETIDGDESNPQGNPESTPFERQQAQELASALNGDGGHPLLDLAEALQNAYAPCALQLARHEQLVKKPLARTRPGRFVAARTWRYLAPGLALAAGVALWFTAVQPPATKSERAPVSELARTRSLSPMFAETLEQPTPTERIDRIYAVRSKELRHNRYTLWRVR
ncbi:MAG TPA: hypothetical protein VKP30_09240 [Polyangiaceae bacterium]|nr:hypothetical protein [Polyangiaceae bacterium]